MPHPWECPVPGGTGLGKTWDGGRVTQELGIDPHLLVPSMRGTQGITTGILQHPQLLGCCSRETGIAQTSANTDPANAMPEGCHNPSFGRFSKFLGVLVEIPGFGVTF